MTERIRVFIIDDDVATRIGLRVILNSESDMDVVGESANADDAFGRIAVSAPDVVLMDVQLPGTDGIAATERITSVPSDAGPRVIVLTTFEFDDYVFRSLEAGASGFLLKRAGAEELAEAVRAVAGGNALPAPAVTRQLIERFAGASTKQRAALSALTERECEVLVLIARGLSNYEIAGDLSISLDTVKSHVKHVFMKLAVRDRAQAVIAAYESGLVAPNE